MKKHGWKRARGAGLAAVLLAGCIGEEPTVPTFPECAVGATLCGGTCVVTFFDALHCGSCDNACDVSRGEVCSYGLCSCGEDRLTCDDGCFDPLSDPLHCGDCDTACDTTSGEVCSDGACMLACGGGTERCGDGCVSTQVDPKHCGDCETACAAGEVCSKGKCALSCAGGTTKCGASCVDTDHDPRHCGDCSTSCDTAAGSTCSDGECTPSCSGGTTSCDDRCVDLKVDPAHCGDCDTQCDDLATCDGGTCRCPDGYSGNGESCRDVDECVEDDPCSPSGECINVEGSYACRCHDGQTGDGETCTGFELVTYDRSGVAAGSVGPFVINFDGNFVAFMSDKAITPESSFGNVQTYVRDVSGHSSVLASVNAAGSRADKESVSSVGLSADGNLVAFISLAENLGSGKETDGPSPTQLYDLFIRNARDNETAALSLVDGTDLTALGGVGQPVFSDDGRFVAFQSLIDDGGSDIRFAIYRATVDASRAEVVDVNDTGQGPELFECDLSGATRDGNNPSMSRDGSRIVFDTPGINLSELDDNCNPDVYLRDLRDPKKPKTTLLSVNPEGDACSSPTRSGAVWPSISGDGNLVAFESDCTDLVGTDTKNYEDIFVRDLTKGTTRKVSVDLSGGEATGSSHRPTISADGRYVAFVSEADDLVNADDNEQPDIFVRDLQEGVTIRVDLDANGNELVLGSNDFAFARGGGAIVFKTEENLLGPDTNAGSESGPWDLYVRYLR